MLWKKSQKSNATTKPSKSLDQIRVPQSLVRRNRFDYILDEVYIDMFYTKQTYFALRTISLLDGNILIFKSLPISDKTARYVPSQETAIDHTISLFGARRSHKLMYKVSDKGFVEAVYRRQT